MINIYGLHSLKMNRRRALKFDTQPNPSCIWSRGTCQAVSSRAIILRAATARVVPTLHSEVMSDSTNAAAGQATAGNAPEAPAGGHDVIKALGHILKSQTGEPMTNEKISNLLIQNMASLVQQGKLTQNQIMQVCGTLRLYHRSIFSFQWIIF